MGFVRFTRKVARARNIAALAVAVMDEAGALTGSRAVGVELATPEGPFICARAMPPKMLARYEAVGREHDVVLADANRTHAPLAMSVADLRTYARAHRLPAAYMSLLDYSVGHHYMLAPLIVDGEVAGALRFARAEDRAFGRAELAVASALGLHVSTRLTALRASARIDRSWKDVLTVRSFEVAELAARGLTTHEVGRLLGVSPNTIKKHLRTIYERLSVGSRAELATLLAMRSDTITSAPASRRTR